MFLAPSIFLRGKDFPFVPNEEVTAQCCLHWWIWTQVKAIGIRGNLPPTQRSPTHPTLSRRTTPWNIFFNKEEKQKRDPGSGDEGGLVEDWGKIGALAGVKVGLHQKQQIYFLTKSLRRRTSEDKGRGAEGGRKFSTLIEITFIIYTITKKLFIQPVVQRFDILIKFYL